MEDEVSARDWSLAKMAVEEGVDTEPIDMRGVGTAVVSEGEGMRRDSTVQEGDQKNHRVHGITETNHPSGKNPRGESLNAERKEQEKKKQESKKCHVWHGYKQKHQEEEESLENWRHQSVWGGRREEPPAGLPSEAPVTLLRDTRM